MTENKEEKNEREVDFRKISRAKRRLEIQGLLKKMALAFGDEEGRGLLHRYEVIGMLKSQVGNNPLKEEWGDDYEKKSEKLIQLGEKVSNLNFFFNQLEQAKIKKEQDPTSKNFIRFRKMYSDVILESHLLYDAFHILLKATEVVKYLSIPHEYWNKDYDPNTYNPYRRGR